VDRCRSCEQRRVASKLGTKRRIINSISAAAIRQTMKVSHPRHDSTDNQTDSRLEDSHQPNPVRRAEGPVRRPRDGSGRLPSCLCRAGTHARPCTHARAVEHGTTGSKHPPSLRDQPPQPRSSALPTGPARPLARRLSQRCSRTLSGLGPCTDVEDNVR